MKLSDIAEITYEEPPIRWGRHLEREYAIALTVYKESTANTVDVVRAVNRVIEDAEAVAKGVAALMTHKAARQSEPQVAR